MMHLRTVITAKAKLPPVKPEYTEPLSNAFTAMDAPMHQETLRASMEQDAIASRQRAKERDGVIRYVAPEPRPVRTWVARGERQRIANTEAIMAVIRNGMTTREVAEAAGMKRETVANNLRRMMQLGLVQNRAERGLPAAWHIIGERT